MRSFAWYLTSYPPKTPGYLWRPRRRRSTLVEHLATPQPSALSSRVTSFILYRPSIPVWCIHFSGLLLYAVWYLRFVLAFFVT